MDASGIVKGGIVGGIVAVVLEFLVGWALMSHHTAVYDFGFIALLVGGFIAGWMIKGKLEDAAVAGAVAGIVYIVLGVLIIFPAVAHVQSGNAVVALVVGIVLGAIGGAVASYICPGMKKSGKSGGKKR